MPSNISISIQSIGSDLPGNKKLDELLFSSF